MNDPALITVNTIVAFAVICGFCDLIFISMVLTYRGELNESEKQPFILWWTYPGQKVDKAETLSYLKISSLLAAIFLLLTVSLSILAHILYNKL